jgi:hypothetical protein
LLQRPKETVSVNGNIIPWMQMTNSTLFPCCRWYFFNDSRVQAVNTDQVKTDGAYLLFFAKPSLLNVPF